MKVVLQACCISCSSVNIINGNGKCCLQQRQKEHSDRRYISETFPYRKTNLTFSDRLEIGVTLLDRKKQAWRIS